MDCCHAPRISRRTLLQGVALAGAALTVEGTVRPVPPVQAQVPASAPPSVAELQRLADDVYQWRIIGHNAIFIVTDEGVIATDPCGLIVPRSPQMYRAAIAMVTDLPVRYVVYSHDHEDHNKGGAVFADTAEFVAHRLAAPKIAARNDPDSPVPTILVDERLELTLGGTRVELLYTGRNHSDNSLVLLYPARRLLFAVDFIPVRAVHFRDLPDSYPQEWIESLRWIEQNLDFDILAPGHGPLGSRDTVREVREYTEDLVAAIRSAQAQGLPDNSEEMVAAVRAALAPRYGSWAEFDAWLPLNIQGIIRNWAAGQS
jgi:glyoxylase-like metal-dependent hydrolase (beta-lactamase superfamily II)